MAARLRRLHRAQDICFRQFFTQTLKRSKAIVLPFDNYEVKAILKNITGRNLDKIFAPRKQSLVPPSYKLMTDTEFLKAQQEIEQKAESLLEMPSVMDEREELHEVLEETSELAHISESNFVFTDISTSKNDRTRSVLIREPSGRLRTGTWEERDRMNLVYFPKPGRKDLMPELLKDENIKAVFRQNRHEDVLDLACVQFEPDSTDYIRVHHTTYEEISARKKFDILRSTRHFGGLVYYLAKNQRIMGLLEDMMDRNLWDDSIEVVKLHHLLHPYNDVAQLARQNSLKKFPMVRAYIRRYGSPVALQKVEDKIAMLESYSEQDDCI